MSPALAWKTVPNIYLRGHMYQMEVYMHLFWLGSSQCRFQTVRQHPYGLSRSSVPLKAPASSDSGPANILLKPCGVIFRVLDHGVSSSFLFFIPRGARHTLGSDWESIIEASLDILINPKS